MLRYVDILARSYDNSRIFLTEMVGYAFPVVARTCRLTCIQATIYQLGKTTVFPSPERSISPVFSLFLWLELTFVGKLKSPVRIGSL